MFKEALAVHLGKRRVRPEYEPRLTVSVGPVDREQTILGWQLLWARTDPALLTPEDPEWNEPMQTILSFELDRTTGEVRLVFEDPIFVGLLEEC